MKIRTLQVEAVADLTEEGIWCATYIGEQGEPAAEFNQDWESWIEQQIEFHTLADRTSVPISKPEDVDFVFATVRTLREVATKLENRLLELDAFDRPAWLDANNGTFDNTVPKEKFLTPMLEVVNK